MATKRKPSPAQLAARALFAQRAKTGTLHKNPSKRKATGTKKYVTRPSQATGEPPSTRLKQRRKKTLAAPRGYFANPAKHMGYHTFAYVIVDHKGKPVVGANSLDLAKRIAQNLADNTGRAHAIDKNYQA